MRSLRSIITSSIKVLALCILLTVLYIFLMLKFAAVQFCQRYFFQRVSKQGSKYALVLNSRKLMDIRFILLLGGLRFYYDISRFTVLSPRRPKKTANVKSCLLVS